MSSKKQQNIYASAAKRMATYQAEQAEAATTATKKTRDVRTAILATAGALVIAFASQWAYFSVGPGATPVAKSATLTMNGNPMPITLDPAHAPKAVDNFIKLAKQGFYSKISCHRITTSGIYVLQCGDPKGDGTGGPGYSWGPVENAPLDNVSHTGVLAMARQSNNASSMGSQFFIVYKDSTIPSDSAGGYTVFGNISNLAALDSIIKGGSDNSNASGDGHPVVKATIDSVTVN